MAGSRLLPATGFFGDHCETTQITLQAEISSLPCYALLLKCPVLSRLIVPITATGLQGAQPLVSRRMLVREFGKMDL